MPNRWEGEQQGTGGVGSGSARLFIPGGGNLLSFAYKNPCLSNKGSKKKGSIEKKKI